MIMKGTSAASLLLLGLVANSAAFAQEPAATATQSKLESCYLKGISEQVKCGQLAVPENYELPNGRQISINYAVLPAVSESKKNDPLLILAGGPGQAATELAAMINRMFSDIRRQRDILLIDQRGTGKSNPLSCAIDHVDELVKTDDDMHLDQMAADCLAQYPDTDLTQYHSVNAIRDFEAV